MDVQVKKIPTWRPHWLYILCQDCGHRFYRQRTWGPKKCQACREEARVERLRRYFALHIHDRFHIPCSLLLDRRDAPLFEDMMVEKIVRLGAPFWQRTPIEYWDGDPETGEICTRFVAR